MLQRKDLTYTGRTLFGAMPPKGQEMDDHYLGTIRQRISAYMKEVNEECWKLGVTAKTQHNEVAPAQHELASCKICCLMFSGKSATNVKALIFMVLFLLMCDYLTAYLTVNAHSLKPYLQWL